MSLTDVFLTILVLVGCGESIAQAIEGKWWTASIVLSLAIVVTAKS